jgi:hypothetical protein
MVPADDQARPARHDAADELRGVDLILECERAASRRNPRDRDPKRWTKTAWRRPIMVDGLFIVGATTALSADLVRWNVIWLLEQPPFCAGVEMGLDSIAVPLQSATPFRS